MSSRIKLDKNKRIMLFIFGCLLARSLPIIILKKIPKLSIIIVLFYLGIGLSFLKTFLFSKSEYGFFGGKVWWNNLRLFHSLIYLSFVVLFITTKKLYINLLIFDLVISLLSVINNYV